MNIITEIKNYILEKIEGENETKAVLSYLIERDILAYFNVKELEKADIKTMEEGINLYYLGRKYFFNCKEGGQVSLKDELGNILFRIDIVNEDVKSFLNLIKEGKTSGEYIKVNTKEETYDYYTTSVSNTQEVYSAIIRAKKNTKKSKRKEYFDVEYAIPDRFRQIELETRESKTIIQGAVAIPGLAKENPNYYEAILNALEQKNEERGPIRIKLK